MSKGGPSCKGRQALVVAVATAVLFLLTAGCCPAAETGSQPLIDMQTRPWQPAPPATQVPLWPESLKLAPPATPGDERFGFGQGKVAGKSVTIVEHVSRPTMTIYRPTAPNTGAAMVVFPGGGYRVLAMDLEGTEICDWLVAKGITCVLLKYRVPGSGEYWADECISQTSGSTLQRAACCAHIRNLENYCQVSSCWRRDSRSYSSIRQS